MAHHHQQFSFDDEDAAPNTSSDFSRLIQRANRSSASAHHSELATRYYDSVYSSHDHDQQQYSSYSHDVPTLGSWFLRGGRESPITHEEERGTSQYLFIITVGTLYILYTGLTLSSFAANVWTETWIQVQVLTILPPQWIPMRTSSLSSLLQQLNASSYRSAAVLLWITTLLIPCCFMVVVPSVIILYRNDFFQKNGTTSSKSDMKLRRFLELSMRWTLAVVWMEAILAFWGPHLVKLEWTRTSVSLYSRVGPGLVCYAVGCLCAILLTVLLRSAGPTRHGGMISSAGSHQNIAISEPPRRNRSIRTPPPHAFRQFRLLNASSDDDDDDDKTSPLLQILEETPLISRLSRTSTDASQPHTPDPPTKPLSFLQLLLVFQVGLLSILCIVPTLVLPAVSLKISGVASEFTPHRTRTIFLHQLPSTLLHTTTATTAAWWLGWLVLVPTIVIPAVATAVAVRIWTHASPHQRAVGRRWLYQWHPAVSGGVAAVAVVVALHVLESWNVWNSNNSNPLFCDAFMMKNTSALVLTDQEPCWKVTVQSLMGLWFWVLQSILLEAFIFLTLAWS